MASKRPLESMKEAVRYTYTVDVCSNLRHRCGGVKSPDAGARADHEAGRQERCQDFFMLFPTRIGTRRSKEQNAHLAAGRSSSSSGRHWQMVSIPRAGCAPWQEKVTISSHLVPERDGTTAYPRHWPTQFSPDLRIKHVLLPDRRRNTKENFGKVH